jgi:hypothetical protein
VIKWAEFAVGVEAVVGPWRLLAFRGEGTGSQEERVTQLREQLAVLEAHLEGTSGSPPLSVPSTPTTASAAVGQDGEAVGEGEVMLRDGPSGPTFIVGDR